MEGDSDDDVTEISLQQMTYGAVLGGDAAKLI